MQKYFIDDSPMKQPNGVRSVANRICSRARASVSVEFNLFFIFVEMILKFLRKVFSLVLVPVMLGAQTGIVFSFHYCKGDLIESSVYLPVHECAMDPAVAESCNEDEAAGCKVQISSDCCLTKVVSVQTDHNLIQKSKPEIQYFSQTSDEVDLTNLLAIPRKTRGGVIRPGILPLPAALYIIYGELLFYG